MRRKVVLFSNDGAIGSGEDDIVVDQISERGDVVGQHRHPQMFPRISRSSGVMALIASETQRGCC